MARHFANVSDDKFVAFIERHNGTALITVHPRPAGDRYGIDFGTKVSEYETLSKGAIASARREFKRLAAQVSA